MEKAPETQAHMLWFFELVSDYVISKSNDLSIRTNPIKNVLFGEKDISYTQWITGIIDNFGSENDEEVILGEEQMISLIESIRNAEAPQIGLKQFARKLFDTKPDVLEESERAWLQALYTQWPDESVTNKQNTISKEDKKERDRIAKKYIFDHSDRGTASPEEIATAEIFRQLVSTK